MRILIVVDDQEQEITESLASKIQSATNEFRKIIDEENITVELIGGRPKGRG